MNKKQFFPLEYLVAVAALVLLVPVGAFAQEGEYRYADATQLWRLTDNAAGFGLDASADRGYAEFEFEHREGDYRRVQEGGQRNQLTFTTERYQKISMLLVGYGRFQFDMDRTKDRAWCDVMRPYNANPYFSGSSIAGKYDSQNFDLTAAVSTIPIPMASDHADRELLLGARLDYKVGDLSRLRDPRSRSELLDYKVTPSVAFVFGHHTVGLNGHYDRRKEKIPNMTTEQTDPNMKYYTMTGLEQANGLVGGYGGYSREWVNHEFGAELNYGYRQGALNSLTSVAVSRGVEDVWGQYKYEPGKFTSYRYALSSHNRITTDKTLHQLDLTINMTDAFADEYRQQLIQERDAEHGYTSYRYETQIEFSKRYQVKTRQGTFHYRCSWLDGAAETGYAGMSFAAQDVKNSRLLHRSDLHYNRFDLQAEGAKAFFGRRLWVDLSATYHFSDEASLRLADASTDYAQGVLIPDMAYYRANYWQGRAEVKYLFPLAIKQTSVTCYVKAYGDYLRTNNDRDASTVGLAVGMIQF